MRPSLIAANWKMNGCKASIAGLLKDLLQGLADKGRTAEDGEVLLCPASPYLAQVQAALQQSWLGLGAQNLCTAEQGAYTGEVSALMLKDFACDYVIVGHSERRELYAENDSVVAEKFAAAQSHGIRPILCVGESRKQREAGETEAVILGQLRAVLEHVGIAAFRDAVIAYEPVWAIGTGLTASPEQAQEVHALIRAELAGHSAEVADSQRIIYGGSVKAANAVALFAQQDIDGGLVGGASLDAHEFVAICAAAGTQ